MLAEAGVSEGTMMDIMGQMSTAMLKRCSHIRPHARREAIDALELPQFSNPVANDSAKEVVSDDEKMSVTH
jgi:hypothetical protein